MSEPTDSPPRPPYASGDADADDPAGPFAEPPEDQGPLDPDHPFFTHEPIPSDGETWSVTEIDDVIYD